jgi:hypothetical protein
MLTGRAVTGILHLLNQTPADWYRNTPADWYRKQQATVEIATFGSEFTAARMAVDLIFDLRITLQYIGVPVSTKSSVVTNSKIPHTSLNKRHNAKSYHRVWEMIAAQILVSLD